MAILYDSAPMASLRPIVFLPLLACALGILYVVYNVVYNLFFHPLSKFPGPKLWAIHYGPYACLELSGDGHRRMVALHQKYGPVIRVAPDHLSFCHPDAIHDVSGHRKPGQLENLKEEARFMLNGNSLINADRQGHGRMRKSMANGFSQQAMIDQQSLIKVYFDALFDKFREFCVTGEKFDILSWYHFAAFDVMGDLSFGESFYCLQDANFHPWVSILMKSIKSMAFDSSFRRMGFLHKVLALLTPKAMLLQYKQHRELSEQMVRKRIDANAYRNDFVTSMLARKGKDALSFDELCNNVSLLIMGGSETVAAAIAAATYYLGSNPEPFKKLCGEVRSAFKSEEEIDILSVGRLEYLDAVINEALRMHTPGPGTSPRTINEKGDTVMGHFIPPGTHIEIWYWTVFHFPEYWTQPEEFIPERWLGDPRFENDQRRIFTPFSVGPRACIGKNLAIAEIRLILARLVWNYDLEVDEESIGWDKSCKSYIVFEKPPLYMRLKARK